MANGAERRTALVPSASGRWRVLVVALAVVAGGTVLFMENPSVSTLFPPCPFHALTGLHCPGCGTLRALHCLLHGNLAAAMAMNPFAVLALPLVAYGCLSETLRVGFGRRLPSVFIRAGWIWTLLGVIIAYWILRNLPFYPFSLLAPHAI